jgi:splicing factor 3A subunit 3
MSASRLEQQRLLHHDIEAQSRKIVDELLDGVKLSTDKEHILLDHRVAIRLKQLVQSGNQLVKSYDDPDGIRAAELEDIAGENVFGAFYDRLKAIREYHRQFPNAGEMANIKHEVKPRVRFSGQEAFGKFVDLQTFFESYVNLPMVKDQVKLKGCDYMEYLNSFYLFDNIPKNKKLGTANYTIYNKYITQLLQYLTSYHERIQPLVDLKELMAIIDEDFEKEWMAKNVVGWFPGAKRAKPEGGAEDDAKDANGEFVQCVALPSEKEILKNDDLYCKACEKSFSKHTTFQVHLKGRKHKKNAARLAKGEVSNKRKETESKRSLEVALTEYRIFALADLMSDRIESTKVHVEKKQTRTLEEIQADLEEQVEDAQSDSESDDDDKPLYNPLNLPLGWDDKPIPYWLYKLHGLNLKFDCEICGGYAYWGPRAFERHFTEWRHTYGMRCLGIQMSPHFMNITKFEDAIALNEKIQKKNAVSGWKPEEEEEFEDDQGNVFNKKTYEDLKRQGII